jgi:hypothetical protein
LVIQPSSGNALLGTTTDAGYKLKVLGASDAQMQLDVAAGGAYTTQVFANGGSGKGFIYWNNGGSVFEFGTYVAGASVRFNTGVGTAALTLTSSQQVQVNATTDSTNTTSGALIVSGGAGIAKTLSTTGRIVTTTVKTGNYTATTSDHVIVCNSASNLTITLISASANTGRHLIIKNKNTGTVTVDATSLGQVDGLNTISLNQYQSATLVSDGATWNRI